jgi:protein SCO1/2
MKILLFILVLLSIPNFLFAQVQGTELDEPTPIPEFVLSDNSGNFYTQENLLDKWTLLMFGFTSCPDVCPFTLQNLEDAVAETSLRVSPANVPEMVFVSVDPDRDRETVKQYAAYFHPNFKGLTGEIADIDRLVEATGSFYRHMQPDILTGFYDVQHSAFVSVIGPDAQMHAKLDPPFHTGKTAEFLARLQIKYRRQNHQ